MDRAQWAETFNISDKDISEWKAQMAPGEDPLQWGLSHGKLPEPRYLKWAMEAYELPLVTNDFFAIPADVMFWDRIKSLHAWRPDFFPLAEWEGVLLIACLQPPQDFHFRQPHRFVLASVGNLQMMWSSFNPSAQSHVHSAGETSSANGAVASTISSEWQSESTITGTNLELKAETQVHVDRIVESESSSDSSLAEDAPEGLVGLGSDPSPNDPANEPVNEPVTESPEGLSFDFSSLSEGEVSPPSESQNDSEPELDIPIGFAEGTTANLDLDFSGLGAESIEARTPSSEVESAAAPAADTAQTSTLRVPELKPATHIPTPPPPQPFGSKPEGKEQVKPAASSSTAQPSRGVLRELEAVREATAASPHLNHEPRGQESLIDFATQVMNSPIRSPEGETPEAPLDSCRTYDDLAAQTLLRVQKTFEQSMILLFQGGELKPWKWSANVTSASGGKTQSIPLEAPSIFRIVFRTCLPYHGLVVGNPINDRFFAEFRNGQTPAHVTITPIMIDNQIGGMLMGITNGKIDYKSSLNQMERLTDDVGLHLKRLRGTKAA